MRNLFCIKRLRIFLVPFIMAMFFGINSTAAGNKIFVDMTPMTGFNNSVYGSYGVYKKKTDIYNKIVITKPCRLVVAGNGSSSDGRNWSLSVTLCDSSYKPVEKGKNRVNNEQDVKVTYGIGKGTYYIKVSKEKQFVLVAMVDPVQEKSGNTKKKRLP